MTRTPKYNLRNVSSICVLAATISACGGGSSGSGDVIEDTQGILGATTDTDNDGLTDAFEDTIGTDPNSFDSDDDGLSDGEEFDDFFTNPLEPDSDGDGVSDGDEIIAQTDPLDPLDGGTTGEPVADSDPCDDPNSSNDTWADNCQLRRFGTFADSSYTRGVQRILWCQNNNNEQAVGINTFADGELGPGTDASIRAYQTANPPLVVDGIVGPLTWTALRGNLQENPFLGLDSFNGHYVEGCGDSVVQFYQQTEPALDNNGQIVTELLGWTLAEVPGSNVMVDFSSEF